jgi:Domain of unknown function (DUF222)/HNH endonuclease
MSTKVAQIAVSPAIAALAAAVDLFCSREPAESPEALGWDLSHLRHQCDRLELEFSRSAAEFAATDEYDAQGFVSPIHWIRNNCNMGGGAAADRIAVGELALSLPRSIQATEDGEIGFAHLALIARTGAAVGNARSTRLDETELLDKALEFSVGRFRDFCDMARHAADAERYVRGEVQAVEARTLTIQPGENGLVFLRGTLDAEGGAAVRTALEPLARRNGKCDAREPDRRMADALIELAAHALDAGVLPQHASQRAHVQVTTTLETLIQRAGAPAAHLELSIPISAKAVERITCDCNVTRILLGADSAVIDVGRSKRQIPPATRRALNVRDKGCRWPGCDRPASWTAGHHFVHWTKDGPTDLSNLVLLCHRHHWMVHEGGWQIVRVDGDRFRAIPPTLDFYQRLARGPSTATA